MQTARANQLTFCCFLFIREDELKVLNLNSEQTDFLSRYMKKISTSQGDDDQGLPAASHSGLLFKKLLNGKM